jgi:hypothetical protein
MNRHSAHQIAETVMYAAEELRGYMNPDDPFPWELTENDHLAILPRLDRSISALADGIRGIAQATGDEYAQRQLTDSYHELVQASAGVRLALSSFDDESGKELEKAAEPVALAASSFPQPMTADVLQEAAPASATGATAAVARPAMASPRQSR